jgi:hypothetical protein
MDGARIDADLFDAIARERGNVRGLAEFRDRVETRPRWFDIQTSEEDAPRRFGCFQGFLRFLFEARIDAVYLYDGERDFSALEWCIFDDKAHAWERTSKEEQRTETGAYKIVQGWKYAELSADSGARYYFGIWQQRQDKRKRTVTRGAQFYALKNIYTRGENEMIESFHAGELPRACGLFKALDGLNALCRARVGLDFIQKNGKPLALTVGTLARIALFRAMYGNGTPKENDGIFKKNHKQEKGTGAWFRARKLFRGGVNCGAWERWGVVLGEREDGATLKKYDVNSEFSFVARNMPDLSAPEVCADIGELFNRRAGYTYIAVFSRLTLRRKRGMPAVFSNPWNGAQNYININKEFAIFADELDEVLNFYDAGDDCEILIVFRCREHSRGVFAPFVDKWYKEKAEAKERGDAAAYTFAKMMNNNAWGQLGKRSKFPVVIHEYNKNTQLFELRQIEPAEDEDDGAFSFILGARVPSLARIYIMQKIRAFCGDKNALRDFVYCDTDSITTYATPPAEDVDASRLGAFKLETTCAQAVFLSKKLYYTISSFSPLSIDIHARGINAGEIVAALLDNYGVESVRELPADAFALAFNSSARFVTPCTLNVRGGRVKFYVEKAISLDDERKKIKYKSLGGAVFAVDENGALFEI